MSWSKSTSVLLILVTPNTTPTANSPPRIPPPPAQGNKPMHHLDRTGEDGEGVDCNHIGGGGNEAG
ncbi:MAG: hypothetical protein GY832_06160 [Chloroflexi bacterium]|nr:hypothetical protein [Chloroflexota bacterium]